jgi:hypothetical protein
MSGFGSSREDGRGDAFASASFVHPSDSESLAGAKAGGRIVSTPSFRMPLAPS